jgi:hypothetical protein
MSVENWKAPSSSPVDIGIMAKEAVENAIAEGRLKGKEKFWRLEADMLAQRVSGCLNNSTMDSCS